MLRAAKDGQINEQKSKKKVLGSCEGKIMLINTRSIKKNIENGNK